MATVVRGRGKSSQKRRVLQQSPARSSEGEASKKDLTCSVCLDRLKDPKLLPCLHTYCKGCLQGILRKLRGKSNIQCPQCRSTHAVPSGGVNEFPSDMVLANALDFHSLKEKDKSDQPIPCNMCTEDDPATTYCPTCSKFLCEFCSKAHKRQVDYRDHKTVSLGDLDAETIKGFERPRRCSYHSGELLKLYCKTCHKLICRDCTLVDHHNHKFGFLKDIRPGIQKQVEASVEMVATKRKELETHLGYMKNIEKSREYHSKALKGKINDAFDSYIAKLQSHRKQLLEKEMKSNDADLKQIWAQKDFIEMTLASIVSSMHYAAQLCDCSSDLDMLAMSDYAIQQLATLEKMEWNPTSQLQMSLPLIFQLQTIQVVGNVNSVSLDSFSVSISRADSVPSLGQQQHCQRASGVKLSSQQQQCQLGVPASGASLSSVSDQQQQWQRNIPVSGVNPSSISGQQQQWQRNMRATLSSFFGRQQQWEQEMPVDLCSSSAQQQRCKPGTPDECYGLGMAVKLVVRVQPYKLDTLPPVSSSLIIPSISVSKQYGGSVNYVVTHQGEGSWIVTVKPLHGGQYYVTASLQQHPTAASTHEMVRTTPLGTKGSGRATYARPTTCTAQITNVQYTFSVSGSPEIGARVRRGPDWPQGNNEDGGIGNRGTVISPFTKQQTKVRQTQLLAVDTYSDSEDAYSDSEDAYMYSNSFVYVEWDNGNREQYEWGHAFPIELVPY